MSTIEGFHCTQDTSPQVPKVSTLEGFTLYRTLHQVPKVSTIEGFHCIQDTSPGPQGSHNRGVPKMRTPLYTGHSTRSPRCPPIEGFHCIQDTSPGPQGVHNRGVPHLPKGSDTPERNAHRKPFHLLPVA